MPRCSSFIIALTSHSHCVAFSIIFDFDFYSNLNHPSAIALKRFPRSMGYSSTSIQTYLGLHELRRVKLFLQFTIVPVRLEPLRDENTLDGLRLRMIWTELAFLHSLPRPHSVFQRWWIAPCRISLSVSSAHHRLYAISISMVVMGMSYYESTVPSFKSMFSM